MKPEIFEKILEARIEKTRAVLNKKKEEYAPGEDRLHNFKIAAAMEEQTKSQAVVGMMKKHWVSVLDMVKQSANGISPSFALINEKIGDSINYLILLEAAILEEVHLINMVGTFKVDADYRKRLAERHKNKYGGHTSEILESNLIDEVDENASNLYKREPNVKASEATKSTSAKTTKKPRTEKRTTKKVSVNKNKHR